MMCSRPTGTPGFRPTGGTGARLRMKSKIARELSPRNGRVPVADMRSESRRQFPRLFTAQRPLPVTAMNGAGYFRNTQGRGVKRNGRTDQIAHAFGIRIAEIALGDVGGIEIVHQPRSRLSEMNCPLSSGNRGKRFRASQCAAGKPGAGGRAGLISATGTPLLSITTTSPCAARSTTAPVRRCSSRMLTRRSHIAAHGAKPASLVLRHTLRSCADLYRKIFS
jgi:hypothetical protein